VLSRFDYFRPQVLEDALTFLQENTNTKILAGGTDLMVMLRRNAVMAEHILDIKSIPETKRLEYTLGRGLYIGASITVNEVAQADFIQQKYIALVQGANSLASYQLRNRATLAGNICNASPGADLAAPLLVYEAIVHIASSRGTRQVACEEFFTGVKKTVLQEDEMVIGISLPDVADTGDCSIFLKQARIKGHDLGIAAVAIRRTPDNGYRIAMTAVAPTPIRLKALETMLTAQPLTAELAGQAGSEAGKLINPISDVRASAQYRLHISGILVKRALTELLVMGRNENVPSTSGKR